MVARGPTDPDAGWPLTGEPETFERVFGHAQQARSFGFGPQGRHGSHDGLTPCTKTRPAKHAWSALTVPRRRVRVPARPLSERPGWTETFRVSKQCLNFGRGSMKLLPR